MQTGYYSSAAGMVTQFNRLETIANNLANVNSAGFKEDNLVVGDFMRLYKESRDELPNENHSVAGAKYINRAMTRAPQIVDSYTDFSVGNMQKTGNQLDFALSKEGLFFAVKTPQGVRLTRDGSFSMNDEGKLVTKQGYEVLPSNYFETQGSIAFNVQDSVIEADKNGQLYKNIPNTATMAADAKLFIVQPDNLAMLKKEGDNLYVYDELEQSKSVDESGGVIQGFVEKSNVNAVKMMTQMIETNRLVGMYQKAMDSQMNDMNRDAIEKIARKA
ncbi:MAG: flagellar hook-basal body protein [Sulfurimonas sp.]|jgi:flagellar basal-body rod protein FlgF|nr:flagellar hook-basal body protein [Sulfurimonas sp.]MBU1216260.1 flagellar hook-basal body protein [bacterium]MBU1434566.1 flagellar hook-basal body protein [bacterium]MBU1502144.1 flagellar hook-basal body protein [bacterium]MBU3938930.1 flagellar hook-basal body protein [bacterium]